jgi:hypothetical protein
MSNNIKETNVKNEVTVAPQWTTNEVENESVCSCQCPVCQGFTPVAYINNESGSYYELPEDFSMSVYADIYLTEVMGIDISEMDSIERYLMIQEIVEDIGVNYFIFDYIEVLCTLLGVSWSAQILSEDEGEFNVLCQLECDYEIPEIYYHSAFPNFIFGKEATLPQKRYHVNELAEGSSAVPLIDSFIVGLCEELEVYVDAIFE